MRMISVRVFTLAWALVVVVGLPQAAHAQTSDARAQYKVGDRVEWNIGDIWFKGTIYNAQDGRFQVERDGYGRAQEWVVPSDLRRLAAPRAEAPPAPPQGGAAIRASYAVGDRVEWNIGDIWFKGTIYNAQDGQYQIERDGYGRAREWVTPADLRSLPPERGQAVTPQAGAVQSAARIALPPPVAGLPNSVAVGLYSCTLFGSGNTAGKLRILSGTTSSGVTPDGSGPQHQFTYDAATGAMTWVGGLQVFSWTVEKASYGPDAKGIPNINLHYRARAGGNLNSMGCRRE